MTKRICFLTCLALQLSCSSVQETQQHHVQVSGIYPHLAHYNNEPECGTGALVPWAGGLWVVTYGPHFPFGSSDKLYEITPDLRQIVYEGSIGGTPANRMIHRESNQLFIGSYAIDAERNIRVIPYEAMPGRHTGNARHLSDPENAIYYATMEEGFYEVDVHTLRVQMLYPDGNDEDESAEHDPTNVNPRSATLPGAHGKGLYSGQGVLVYSNNGEATEEALREFDVEAGALAEWDGENWRLVRRNQFVEVTGPGGIYGNESPATDPIWTTGWDFKSLIVGVRNAQTGWSFYRLPKASHSYDGAHGWNTEWPRIRNVGTAGDPDYLMTMHGMFWRFPGTFAADNAFGIRPRSAYLKVIGDFTRWNGRLVFGCDDSAQREFLNTRSHKGGIEGPGQSNSNLWFTSFEKPDSLGPTTAAGSVWLDEPIRVSEPSEPFLFSGWPRRVAWIHNAGATVADFLFEVDRDGHGSWVALKSSTVEPGEAEMVEFTREDQGEWIRVRTTADVTGTVSFNYSDIDERPTLPDAIFTGLQRADDPEAIGGLLYGLGDDRRMLGVAARRFENGQVSRIGYYELDEALNLVRKQDEETERFIEEKSAIPENVITVEESSVLVVDDRGRRWRFPLGDPAFTDLTRASNLRIAREVATERDLFSCHGTFYELPAENADGFAKVRPIASHNSRIHDYASYRGMIVLTGIDPDAEASAHIIRSNDRAAAVWVGVIDDLWKLGKPTGSGGPWKDTSVKAGAASDPYLIGFYDERSLSLSHDSDLPVTFRIEVEPVGHGPWMLYREVMVQPGEVYEHDFPESFQARWIRLEADRDCVATAWLEYR